MEKIQFKVQEYVGPLDLILQLIAKNKLNICDIEISSLLEQYLLAIQDMQENQLDIASEFFEMASRLVYIKTVMLLPRHEEEEDPRKELTGALLEYQACQQAAQLLRQRGTGERFTRPALRLPAQMSYQLVHKPQVLLQAYFGALGRGKRRLPPPRTAFSGIVARRVVSVTSRIAFVLKNLYKRTRVGFYSLFAESRDRPEVVATFLAVLELIKDKRVSLSDSGEELVMLKNTPPTEWEDLDGVE